MCVVKGFNNQGNRSPHSQEENAQTDQQLKAKYPVHGAFRASPNAHQNAPDDHTPASNGLHSTQDSDWCES